jgi:uncharacterized protein YbbC (DUF1343 family)
MTIRTGLQILLEEQTDRLRGMRVGLATHAAAVTPDLTGAARAIQAAGYQLCALFGPEHGLRGAAADGTSVADGREPRTGLPIYSLYGAHIEPTPAMLEGLDVLVFDMQDVGVRFYTYLSTLFYILKGAAKAGLPVLVLDRPNPLGGEILEGPSILAGRASFVGVWPVPVRYGLTLGEMALLLNAQAGLGALVEVVRLDGWQRGMGFEACGLPWVPTSPAIPHLSTVRLYPGMCFLEGTNLSEGRGTSLPFEVAGAPWIDPDRLADELNNLGLAGVRFRPLLYTPGWSKFSGQECGGVQVHAIDPAAVRPTALGLHLIAAVQRLFPGRLEWNDHFDRLAGGPAVRQSLQAGQSVDQITAGWQPGLDAFRRDRQPYLLYVQEQV